LRWQIKVMSKHPMQTYHDALLGIARQAESIAVEGGPSADLLEMTDMRAQTLETLGAYQGYVHRQILVGAREGDAADRLKAAEDLKIACIQVALAYQSFALRWTHAKALADWTGYRAAVTAMADGIRGHVSDWSDTRRVLAIV
jgi:hypothetical protein